MPSHGVHVHLCTVVCHGQLRWASALQLLAQGCACVAAHQKVNHKEKGCIACLVLMLHIEYIAHRSFGIRF